MYKPTAPKQPSMVVRSRTSEPLKTPIDVWRKCADIRENEREIFVAFYLDAAHRVIERHIISVGTLTESLVHPREVFHPAIALNAAAVIVCHNHPSNDPTPSEEDKVCTRRLMDAGRLMGIPVLDHIVLTSRRWESVNV